jgi:hypothetical protein
VPVEYARVAWAWVVSLLVAGCAVHAPPVASDGCGEALDTTSQALEPATCKGQPLPCVLRARTTCLPRHGCTWATGVPSDPFDDACVATAAGLTPCPASRTATECSSNAGCYWAYPSSPPPPQPAPQASGVAAPGCPGRQHPPAPARAVDAGVDAPER